MKIFLKNKKGQAIVETAIFIPILAMISAMLFWGADLMLTKQQLLSAARFGTDLMYYNLSISKETIETKIRNYLTNPPEENMYRKINPNKIIAIEIIDNRKNLDPIFNATDFSKVTIKYDLETPKLFRTMLKYLGGKNSRVSEKFVIESHSAVLAGVKRYDKGDILNSLSEALNSVKKLFG